MQPSQTTVRRWFRIPLHEAPPAPDPTAFSGVLCVDEVYQRDKAVLLAVDPHGSDPFLATQVVVGDLQPAHLEAFFRELEGAGIVPRQLVTDESRLYLPVVKKVWPEVTHQLCLFHVGKNMNERLTELLRAWRHTLPTPTIEKQGRQSLRGRVKDQDSPLAQRKAAAIHEVFRVLAPSTRKQPLGSSGERKRLRSTSSRPKGVVCLHRSGVIRASTSSGK